MALAPASSHASAASDVLTTKGDLLTQSADGTYSRVGIGSTLDALQVTAGLPAWSALPYAWTSVRALSDQSVTSSVTIINDLELFFTAANAVTYLYQVCINYASPAGAGTPDIRCDVGEDSVVRGIAVSRGVGTTEAASVQNVLTDRATPITFGTAAANRLATITGTHAGGGGVFRFRFAQNQSDSNATTRRAGSVLFYRAIS